MSSIYRRPELAATLARQLLNPRILDESLRSGLFLSGLRRTGKTTFLATDLIPALEEAGALVIYVDLWSDIQVNPAALVRRAIRGSLAEWQSLPATASKSLPNLTQAQRLGLKFSFLLDTLGDRDGATLAQALTEVVDQMSTDVVLIIDEVQHALVTEDGTRTLLALKAARDAINSRPDTPGHFIFIGTGSHRALIGELVTRPNQAFAGATAVDYPVLDRDFVEHVLTRLTAAGGARAPTLDVASDAFKVLGNRPEELVKALRMVDTQLPLDADPDNYLTVIAATLRSRAADGELLRLDQLGGLATAIFHRIASDGPLRRLFSAAAASDYSHTLGREVRISEIQLAVNELLSANLIMRRGHGVYGVTDPFVRDTWLEQRSGNSRLDVPLETHLQASQHPQ